MPLTSEHDAERIVDRGSHIAPVGGVASTSIAALLSAYPLRQEGPNPARAASLRRISGYRRYAGGPDCLLGESMGEQARSIRAADNAMI